MAVLSKAAALVCVASMAFASSGSERHARLGPLTVREEVTVAPEWAAVGSPDGNAQVTIQIGLKQANIGGLQEKLLDISNPKSPNYGKWLSKSEVTAFTNPSAETVNLVKLWLASSGIPKSSISHPSSDWIHISAPLNHVENLLDSNYTTFRHVHTNKTTVRTKKYSVPFHLHHHVDTIQPTTAFHQETASTTKGKPIQKPKKAARDVAQEDAAQDPECIEDYMSGRCVAKYYNVDYVGTGRAELAVTGMLNLSGSHDDMAEYFHYLHPSGAGADFNEVSIAGGHNFAASPGLEPNLDTQLAASMVYPNKISFYSLGPLAGDTSFNDELLNLGTYLNTVDHPPSTVTTSYSGLERYFDNGYMVRACNEFMKAGARGVSLFFSSGDYGVGGRKTNSNCSIAAGGFITSFPASCPWVTTVGATKASAEGEVAAMFDSGGSSGGGFSNVFATPDYQLSQVQSYIHRKLDESYGPYINESGRGYLDVAMLGTPYIIVEKGSFVSTEGTSASTPAWASLISLINDHRISLGKPTLGFLNPLLYSRRCAIRDALNDITSGSNPGCSTIGFPAAIGWDPVTGLGSMDFAKMRNALS